jgi:hypothetical protein
MIRAMLVSDGGNTAIVGLNREDVQKLKAGSIITIDLGKAGLGEGFLTLLYANTNEELNRIVLKAAAPQLPTAGSA